MLENESSFNIEGPLGKVILITPRPEILFIIAAGTGASQATSLIESIEKQASLTRTILWWSVSSKMDLYQNFYFSDPQKKIWLTYRSFIDNQHGNNMLVKELKDRRSIYKKVDQYILAGPPGFVFACTDRLIAHGVDRIRLHSDTFN